MSIRESDQQHTGPGDIPLPRVYVNRSLPIWSIIAVLCSVAAAGISLSYQVADIAKEQGKLAAAQSETSKDVKAIKDEQVNAGRKAYEFGFQIGDMNRRIMIVEEYQQRDRSRPWKP